MVISRKIRNAVAGAANLLMIAGLVGGAFAADRFFVSDKDNQRVFKYDDAFAYNTDWASDPANGDPDDVYITAEYVYVLDSTAKRVFRYDYSGQNVLQSKLLKVPGTPAAAEIGTAVGMSVDPVAGEIWVADNNKKMYRYSLADAFAPGASVNALNQYNLHNVNETPHGLSLDETYVYVLDRDSQRIYRYPRANPHSSFQPSRKVRDENGAKLTQPEGMAVVGDYLYILNNDTVNTVHLYSMLDLFTDPSDAIPFRTYTLAPGNTSPFGLGIDKTRAAVSLVPDTTGPTNADSISFNVEFDAPVSNFNDAADLIITHNGTANTGITVTGSGANYTLTVDGITGDGTFTVKINTMSDIQNADGDPLIASATSPAVLIDNTAPVVNTLTPLNGSQLDISFTELNDMGAGALLPATYTASGPGLGTLVPNPTSVQDLGNNTFRLNWEAGSSIFGLNLTIAVDPNLTDAAGNVVEATNLAPTVTALPVSLSGFSVE